MADIYSTGRTHRGRRSDLEGRFMPAGFVRFDTHRFVGHVVDRRSGCWTWHGAVDSHGYGKTCVMGRYQGAHRAYYQRLYGPIPNGLMLDHLCRNPRCVNPKHLEVVTNRENLRRGIRTKLNLKLVQQLRDEYKRGDISYRVLAVRLNVSDSTVRHAIQGRKWARP